MRFFILSRRAVLFLFFSVVLPLLTSSSGYTQQPGTSTASSTPKSETVEWVYRIRYGSHDEWWSLFRKYQVAILERQKQLGYVKDYQVWAPGAHTSEESRWDYRIVITRVSHDAPAGQSESEVAKQLFPDHDAFRRGENRRWELTTNHWDLPIHLVDLNTAP